MSSGSDKSILLVQRGQIADFNPERYNLSCSLLLTQDALYLVQQPAKLEQLLRSYKTIYGLQSDAEARAIGLTADIEWIDYSQWVELTLNVKQVIRI